MKKIISGVVTVIATAVAFSATTASASVGVIDYKGHYTITNDSDAAKILQFALQDAGSNQLTCNSQAISNGQEISLAKGATISCVEGEEATSSGTIYYASTITLNNNDAAKSYYGTIGVPSEFVGDALIKAVNDMTVWSVKQTQQPRKQTGNNNAIAVTIK